MNSRDWTYKPVHLPPVQWKQLDFDPWDATDPKAQAFWLEENSIFEGIPFMAVTQEQAAREMSTEALVTERGKTHGRFEDHAAATQSYKLCLREQLADRRARNQPPLTDMQKESIEMILHKIGRIVAGDANFQDHWDDIAGYAKIANGSF